MKTHTVHHKKIISFENMEKKFEFFISAILGLLGGGFAYIKGVLFLGITWSDFGDKVWAVFFAIVLAMAGAMGKQIYDIKFKERLNKFFKRRKKKP